MRCDSHARKDCDVNLRVPKNQNKCCQRSGDPPAVSDEWTLRLPPICRQKKSLLPSAIRKEEQCRSKQNAEREQNQHRRHKPRPPSEAYASGHAFHAHAQRSAYELTAPINEARQKSPMLTIQRSCPSPDRSSGLKCAERGYCVQPAPVHHRLQTDATITRNETSVVQTESMLTTGKAILGRRSAPAESGFRMR